METNVYVSFRTRARELEQQELERPGEGVAAVSSWRNEGSSAQNRHPLERGDAWSESQGGQLRDVVGQLGDPVEQVLNSLDVNSGIAVPAE
jgi:hypothetical protein